MTRTTLRTGVLGGFLALLASGFTVPAHAAPAWSYVSAAHGTYVQALDSTVTSGYTGSASVTGGPAPASDDNRAAGLQLTQLATVGVIETSASSEPRTDGVALQAKSKVAGVDLLGGLIHADALETTSTMVGGANESSSASSDTRFVGLKIAGVNLPVDIPKNYTVNIPGVAYVVLNYEQTVEQGGSRVNYGGAIAISLLEPRGGAQAGAFVMINPTYQLLVPSPPADQARFRGFAYGLQVNANVGDAARVDVNPTPIIHTPWAGSGGQTLKTSAASLNLTGLLTAGVIESTSTSQAGANGDGEVTNANKTARLNLLGGLITADAIQTQAHGKRTSGNYSGDMSMTLVNLKIAGQPIDVNVSPNTTINVAGLGKVVINEQAQIGTINRIRGLYITLDTAQAGLPIGATIEVAVAATAID